MHHHQSSPWDSFRQILLPLWDVNLFSAHMWAYCTDHPQSHSSMISNLINMRLTLISFPGTSSSSIPGPAPRYHWTALNQRPTHSLGLDRSCLVLVLYWPLSLITRSVTQLFEAANDWILFGQVQDQWRTSDEQYRCTLTRKICNHSCTAMPIQTFPWVGIWSLTLNFPESPTTTSARLSPTHAGASFGYIRTSVLSLPLSDITASGVGCDFILFRVMQWLYVGVCKVFNWIYIGMEFS